MWFGHAGADGLDEREDDQCGDGVTDESRNDQNHGGEDNEDAIEAHALDLFSDGAGDGVEEARGGNGFAEGKTAGGEDDDCPEEVVKVFLGEDAGAEEEDDGDYCYDSHVSEYAFKLMGNAPE